MESKEKEAKYRSSFNQSRAKIKGWEKKFVSEHGRKPDKKDIEGAPQQIQVCYRNCWKIKSYFDKKTREEKRQEDIDTKAERFNGGCQFMLSQR